MRSVGKERNLSRTYEEKQGLRTKRRKRFFSKRTLFIVCMLSIPMLRFAVFYIFVNLQNFVMAFQRYDGEGKLYYTLENFELLFRDFRRGGVGLEAIKNTLGYFLMGILTGSCLSVIFSYFSYKNLWGDTFRRIADAGLGLMSSVSVSIIAMYFFNPGGPFSEFVTAIKGLDEPAQLFEDARFSNGSLFFYVLWTSLGINLIIRGAMMRIPGDILEYGKLDGLNWVQEIWWVILPMIWPTIATVLTLQCTNLLAASGPVYLFTQGRNGTYTVSYWLFEKQLNATAKSNSLHYASAISMAMAIITTPFVLLMRHLLNKIHDTVDY